MSNFKRIYGVSPVNESQDKFHYVYRITNLVESKHYYGARSSKHHPFEDLGTLYFSSSTDKDFIKDQKSNPKNYKYKVIGVFESRSSSIEMEIRLHRLFKVNKNELFYNRARQKSDGFSCGNGKHLKGRIWVTDKKNNRAISRSDLKKWIDNGWVQGQTKNSTRNRVWITNGKNNKLVDEVVVKNWIDNGWFKGKSQSKNTKHKIQITNGNNNTKILPCDLEDWVSKGWYLGYTKKTTTGNKIWITNGSVNKMVYPDKIPAGWTTGMTKNLPNTNGMIWITNGSVNKMVYPDKIPAGYRRGLSRHK